MDYDAWRKGPDWAVLVDSREDRVKNQLMREITVFREVDLNYRRSEERHLVRAFNAEVLHQLLDAAGFSVSVSDCYGDYRLADSRQTFFAVKNQQL